MITGYCALPEEVSCTVILTPNSSISCTSYRPAVSANNIGLGISQTFPNLTLINSKNQQKTLQELITQKTVIMVQPGASHPGQWDGRPEALEAWKAFLDPSQMEKCVAGCTGHLKGYTDQYLAYKEAGYNIIVVMSNKTSKELAILEEDKSSPFSLYSLDAESLQALKRLHHPVFKFENKEYVYRNTWAVTQDMEITDSTNSVNHVAEVSANEAVSFLGDLKKPLKKN
jgi:peroxiredoxin